MGWIFRVVAVVLFVIAALMFFGVFTAALGTALGLTAIGLACWCVSSFFADTLPRVGVPR